jgi:hypothetical protein
MHHVIRNMIGDLVLAMRHIMHHVMRDVIDHVTQSWGLSATRGTLSDIPITIQYG